MIQWDGCKFSLKVYVNLKFQQTKSMNSIFSQSKRSNIKADSKAIQNLITHTKIKQINDSNSDFNKKKMYQSIVEWDLNSTADV